LQSFVSALGQRLKGRAWLLATGQQKLEEGTGIAPSIIKLKDRFPPSLRVHLGVANIRDVVHKRLLRKKKALEGDLRELFQKHRPDLALHAYKGNDVSETDFVEVYPMLPGHIPLLLDITTGLRARSSRTQGDSHAIRGLLQLLGDLFREKDLARLEVGRLITLDLIYDVLHSALDADVQMTIGQALELSRKREIPLVARVIKAVAMLELVQHHQKTSTEIITRCLYERLGQGSQKADVQECLDVLVGESLLGYSEKTGYKIESAAGQDWQKERDAYEPGAEQVSERVKGALARLVSDVDRVSLDGLSIPWLALYSDGVSARDVRIRDERKYTVATVDFQFTKGEGRDEWVPRSDSDNYKDRMVWVVGETDAVQHAAKKLVRSERMVERYGPRQSSLPDDQQRLLIDERNRLESAQRELVEAVKSAFMAGELYFRGRPTSPRELGASFATALAAFGNRVARDLYPHPTTFSVSEKDILYLIENAELTAPPPVFGQDRLGLLTLDAGRYEVTCSGRLPSDVLAFVREHGGVTGSTLLAHFGAPPHGVPPDVLRASVVGLLRAGKIRIELPAIGEITSVRDEGARELLKETGLRKAKLTLNTVETLSPRDRNAICAMFRDQLHKDVARDNDAIADAVAEKFAGVRERLTAVAEQFRRLPKDVAYPETLTKLESALEVCRRDRRVEPTVRAVKRSLDVLRDGLDLLRRMENDLTDAAIDTLRDADDVRRIHLESLKALGPSDDVARAADAIEAHLTTERPWEDTGELRAPLEVVRGAYRARRRAILDAHEERLDQAVDALKRRDGFERLSPVQRHQVLRHLREGAASQTDEHAVAPPLEGLEAHLAARLAAAEAKALAQLDAFLEELGQSPTVDVPLDLSGREVSTEAELERLLEELRRRILHELSANHRVRLK
ncbi:MAG: BREX system P-loop protein BrxC, partial [Polyangiales bacterium]